MDFDGFTFDETSGELRKNGRVVQLHRQPTELLALLLRHAGDVVSREQIRNVLWDDDTFVDFDLGINACIHQIRTALGDDADDPRFVETFPKKGYRFAAALETARDTETRPRPEPRRRYAVAAVTLLALLVTFWPRSPEAPPPSLTAKPSVAVLLFDNMSQDATVDWLRMGLADMLITNFSRNRDLAVLSTDRLLQILRDAGRLEEDLTSEADVRAVVEQAGVEMVILGSFMKSGEVLRINVRVQEARTGTILTTARTERRKESDVFEMVDELTHEIRLGLGRASRDSLALPLAEYATSSVEAYRYFAEAWELLGRSKSREALALYEKAVEEDPAWADAVTMVSMMHRNLGHESESEASCRRALELAKGLDPARRYNIEGWCYAGKEETYGPAIQALDAMLALEPSQNVWDHVVARRLFLLERADEAIERWEQLGRERFLGWMARDQLASAYAHQKRFGDAHRLIREFLARFPDRSEVHAGLGDHWVRAGALDAALEAFETAEAIDPQTPRTHFGRFRVAVLREQWRQAEAAVAPLLSRKSPTSKWNGLRRLAVLALYRGESEKALELLDQAASAYPDPRTKSAAARVEAANVRFSRGQPERALELALAAQREGQGHYPEWEALFLEAKAQADLGRMEAALHTTKKLRQRTEAIPTEKERRRVHHLLGELARIRGDAKKAVVELEHARAMLLPRGFYVPGASSPQHIPIWFSLASAYLEASDDENAALGFERVATSENEHIWWPIPYVRSFYFLGRIYEARGDKDAAREYYRRFYDYWREGDLDRERIAEAREKIRGTDRL